MGRLSQRDFPILPILLLSIVIVWMILLNIRPIQDPDIWWHLASGRYMVQHHTIPKADVFSLTAQGTSWVNTYWLQEIIIFLSYRFGGIQGVTLLNSITIALLVLLIGAINPFHELSLASRVLAVIWIFFAGQPRGFGWEEKASIVTMGFLGLLFYSLQSTRIPSLARRIRWWPLYFMVWANMHRGFILGLGILTIWIFEEWTRNPEDRFTLMVEWVACITATFVNPWGIHVYLMGWKDVKLSPNVSMGWAHTPFFHLEFFWITLAIFWLHVACELRKTHAVRFGFVATSIVLSALSIRYASFYRYFVIWAVPWMMAFFNTRFSLFEGKKLLPWTVSLLGVGIVTAKPAFGIYRVAFPVEAVDFLKAQNWQFPFYHEYELGGYYMWTLDGRPPVLIDGRYEAIEGYGHLFPETIKANQGYPHDFHQFLKHLGLHAAVVKYPSTRDLPNPLSLYFPRKQWALIYWDDVVLIFVERIPAFEGFIAQYEFPFIEPDADPKYWMSTVWMPASASDKSHIQHDFLRNAELHPTSNRVLFWLNIIHSEL
jgi:hypothetical protein